MCYDVRAVPPPKPKLFRAITILGIMLGGLGVLNAIGGLTEQSRASQGTVAALFEPTTEEQAKITRKMQDRLERLVERHRGVVVGLHLANGALSLLLLVGALTIATGRTWAHALMMQALAASSLYEVPAAAHQIRLLYEARGALRRFLPEMARAGGMAGSAPPDQVALVTVVMLMLLVAALSILRLAYYGTGFWYLRRRDVKAWFSAPRDT